MRVLVDHSCVEVYLSSGEVLSTRVYRGQPPHGSDAGIDFVAYGGTARVEVSPRRGARHPAHVTPSALFWPAAAHAGLLGHASIRV